MAQAVVLVGLFLASSVAFHTPIADTGFYTGQDNDFAYSYEMESAESGIRTLFTETSKGWLELRVVRSVEQLEIYTVVMGEEQVLTLNEHGVTISGETSCGSFRARLESLRLIGAEHLRLQAPPEHLVQAHAALQLSTRFSGVEAGCEDVGLPSPSAGLCDLLTSNHDECSSCCESDSRIAAIGCGVLNTLCGFPGCRLLAAGLCGKVTASLRDACVEVECSGKQGDPSCSPPIPPCPFSCQFECGVTQKGVCGDCSYLNPDFVCCGG